jgi:hypothetical protein
MTIRFAGLVVAAAVAISCGSPASHASHSPSPSPGGYVASLGSAGCNPAAVFHGWHGPDGIPEVGMDSSRGSLWALFFHAVPPPSRTEIKVVWRMTGSGPFTFTVSDADGKTVQLAWGPTGHGSSNWDHPGDEVGTGFTFTHAGCWNIHVARSDFAGDLWLEVGA